MNKNLERIIVNKKDLPEIFTLLATTLSVFLKKIF